MRTQRLLVSPKLFTQIPGCSISNLVQIATPRKQKISHDFNECLSLPYLMTLSIEFCDTGYKIKTLFDNPTVPALHTLVLKFSKYDNVMDVELVNMITRCNLKHFTFYGHDSPIEQFLLVMPSHNS